MVRRDSAAQVAPVRVDPSAPRRTGTSSAQTLQLFVYTIVVLVAVDVETTLIHAGVGGSCCAYACVTGLSAIRRRDLKILVMILPLSLKAKTVQLNLNRK